MLIEDDKLDDTLRLFAEHGIQYGDVTRVLDPHKSYMEAKSIGELPNEKISDIKSRASTGFGAMFAARPKWGSSAVRGCEEVAPG